MRQCSVHIIYLGDRVRVVRGVSVRCLRVRVVRGVRVRCLRDRVVRGVRVRCLRVRVMPRVLTRRCWEHPLR